MFSSKEIQRHKLLIIEMLLIFHLGWCNYKKSWALLLYAILTAYLEEIKDRTEAVRGILLGQGF